MAAADRGTFERFQKSIDPEFIEQALQATGTATVRRRRLPAEMVIWLVLGMALFRDLAIGAVVRSLGLVLPGGKRPAPSDSAIAQARARLGGEPLRWLFGRTAQKWTRESADRHRWRGLALYGVDGSTVRVPDSPENRAHFGGQSAGGKRGQSGYPLVRLATLMVLRSHLLAAVRFGPYQSELVYARDLWAYVPDHSLAIVDRGFLAAGILIPLADEAPNRHWLTRARKTTAWRPLKRLGSGDQLVEMNVSHEARRQNPALPEKWTVRAIAYRRRGFQPQTLLTSLLDPIAWPADEIVPLYHERWEIELGFDEVKTEMLEREETIRSRTVAGVEQELWGLALACNLVRLEMERTAAEARVPPSRISFIASLRAIRLALLLAPYISPGALPRHLQRLREDLASFVLPPRRSERLYPRAVKIKMSNYQRKRPSTGHTRAK
jgi:hypothetical protein